MHLHLFNKTLGQHKHGFRFAGLGEGGEHFPPELKNESGFGAVQAILSPFRDGRGLRFELLGFVDQSQQLVGGHILPHPGDFQIEPARNGRRQITGARPGQPNK